MFGMRALATVVVLMAGLLDATAAQAATVDPTAWYVLVNRHSGKALDVSGMGTADGAAVQQWTRYDGTNQQFRLSDSSDGHVRLINRNSNKALEIQSSSTADGAKAVQYTDHGGANQQWSLARISDTPSGPLPSTFRWSSSGVLAGPKSDAQHPSRYSVKDFSVVRHNNQWLIYATTAGPNGWGLENFNFGDWSQAAAAPPTYSTSTNPADPRSWSAPRTFIAQEPEIVRQNKGDGQWIDFWVICDAATCYPFFSDDNGHIYRAQTSLANFPNGFGNTQIALSDSKFALFEGTAVYKVAGANHYLLLQEAIGGTGRRYYRSFVSSSLIGTWTPLAATENEPL